PSLPSLFSPPRSPGARARPSSAPRRRRTATRSSAPRRARSTSGSAAPGAGTARGTPGPRGTGNPAAPVRSGRPGTGEATPPAAGSGPRGAGSRGEHRTGRTRPLTNGVRGRAPADRVVHLQIDTPVPGGPTPLHVLPDGHSASDEQEHTPSSQTPPNAL